MGEKCQEIPILDPNKAIFKQSQKSNQIEFRHTVNEIFSLMTCLIEWKHIRFVQAQERVLFLAAKTGHSRSVSITQTQPAAPNLDRGGATLVRALDNQGNRCIITISLLKHFTSMFPRMDF